MTPQITSHGFLQFSEAKSGEGSVEQRGTQELEISQSVPSGEPGPRRPQLCPHTGGSCQPTLPLTLPKRIQHSNPDPSAVLPDLIEL